MMTNARKHVTPDGDDVSVTRATIFEQFGQSINDVVPVANTTERGQLVTDLVAAGVGPSSSRPLIVLRGDAPGLHRLEYTYDGSVWITSGDLRFSTTATRDSWTTANPGLLTAGDQCIVGATTYVWSGTAWQNNTMFTAAMNSSLMGSPTIDSRLLVQFGSRVGITNGSSVLATTFPTAFPNGLIAVVATPSDASTSMKQAIVNAPSASGFEVQCLSASGAPIAATAVRYNWIAIGF